MNKERQPPFANAMLYANEMTRRVAYNVKVFVSVGDFTTELNLKN